MALAKALEDAVSVSGVYKFIVAVDIGTAYTKVAWIITKQPRDANVYNKWPGAQGKTQVPTAVLYKPANRKLTKWVFAAFGQDAIQQHALEEEESACVLFRKFKMELHKQKVRRVAVSITFLN